MFSKDQKAKIELQINTSQKALFGQSRRAKLYLTKISSSHTWEEVDGKEKGRTIQTSVNNEEEALTLVRKIEDAFAGYDLSIQKQINSDGTVRLAIPTHVVFELGKPTDSIIPGISQLAAKNTPNIAKPEVTVPKVEKIEENLPSVSPNQKDERGRYPFFTALWEFEVGLKKIQKLMEHPEFDPNQRNEKGFTMLAAALEENNSNAALLLLSSEKVHSVIDPNQPTPYGELALERAFLLKKPDLIKSLLSMPQIDVNAVGLHKQFSLSQAISMGNPEIIQLILDNKNFSERQLGPTAKEAIKKGNSALLQQLMTHPKFDVNQIDNEGNTLLNYAISQGNPELVALIKSRQDLLEDLDLPADWSEQGHIMSRALALGECALLKHSEDPLQTPFNEIAAALAYKDGVILFNDELYYVDQKQEKTQKIEKSSENQEKYAQLKAKIAATDSLTITDNETLQLSASIIGHTPGGYKKKVFDDGGVCFGISQMAMQAFMANDYDNFYRRMQLISAIPVDRFNEQITSLEEKRNTLTRQARQEFNQFTGEEKRAFGIDNLDFSDFLEVTMQQSFTKDELLLLDSRALFEGIALYQSPDEEAQLFAKKTNQDVLETAPLIQSKKIEEQQGIVKLAEFSGAYEIQKLHTYFSGLQEAINKADPPLEKNVTLSLGNLRHRILVSFDPQKQKFSLIDPNGISKPFSEENLIKSFSNNGVTVFHTEIYSTQADSAALNSIIENWMQGEKWKEAHRIDQNTVDLEDSKGLNLLHLAIVKDQKETVKALVEAGVDLNKQLTNKYTALQYVVLMDKDPKIIKILLASPALDPNIKDEDERTVLHYALFMDKDPEIIKMLLANPRIDLKVKDKDGRTALEYAIYHNQNPEIIKMLSAATNQVDERGFTPLHNAIQMENLESVQKLLEDPFLDVNKVDPLGYTPLTGAIEKKNPDIVSSLLNHNEIDPNLADRNGNTPFSLSKKLINNEVFIELITKHPLFHINQLTPDERVHYRSKEVGYRKSYSFFEIKGDLSQIKNEPEESYASNIKNKYGRTELLDTLFMVKAPEIIQMLSVASSLLSLKEIDLNLPVTNNHTSYSLFDIKQPTPEETVQDNSKELINQNIYNFFKIKEDLTQIKNESEEFDVSIIKLSEV